MLILELAGQLTAGVRLAFSARRAVLLAAAILPGPAPDPAPPGDDLPRVEVLVPCHNEAASLPALLPALGALEYPRAALRVSVVDDASTDGSAALAQSWPEDHPWARVLGLTSNVGKAQALNLALAGRLHPEFEPDVVVVYDADHRPRPDALRALVAPFTQLNVAGVSGQMRVSNGLDSPAAAY